MLDDIGVEFSAAIVEWTAEVVPLPEALVVSNPRDSRVILSAFVSGLPTELLCP
jgi:hypothetical protein